MVRTELPSVSTQACNAIHNLASAFANNEKAATSGTNALSQYILSLFRTLIVTADCVDASGHNLRISAIETVSVLVQYSAPNVQPVLLQLLPVIMQGLSASYTLDGDANDVGKENQRLQGHLCKRFRF